MIKRLFQSLLLLFFIASIAYAKTPEPVTTASALYMANEGLMVVQGDTKVLFDPLFRNSYGWYQLLPRSMEEALYAGVSPFDGIDAVFISHAHGDHYSAKDILRLLKAQPGIHLYAPGQAVQALRGVAGASDQELFARVTAVNLAYKAAPVSLKMEGLKIEAVRIPHSGWPTTRLDVENISWRVTLNETATVLHMGDADPNDIHFARDASYWDKTHIHMAFPPYWFFNSKGGPDILKKRLKPDHSVGVHLPVDPARRPAGLSAHDLFTVPGETRMIPVLKTSGSVKSGQ